VFIASAALRLLGTIGWKHPRPDALYNGWLDAKACSKGKSRRAIVVLLCDDVGFAGLVGRPDAADYNQAVLGLSLFEGSL